MKVAEQIRRRIRKLPAGQPFTPAEFLPLGARAAIDQALSRMAKTEEIARVGRGVYVRPKTNRYVGKVMPNPTEVAEAIAKSTGATVQIHGAEAARRFELTTQVPMQPIFYTSGPNRSFCIGKLNVLFKHVSPRKLTLAGRPAGQALSALWYLGKSEVTPAVIETIRKKLSPTEFVALKAAVPIMPAWMADAFHRSEATPEHA